jgi:hypothetical protein
MVKRVAAGPTEVYSITVTFDGAIFNNVIVGVVEENTFRMIVRGDGVLDGIIVGTREIYAVPYTVRGGGVLYEIIVGTREIYAVPCKKRPKNVLAYAVFDDVIV